MKTINKYLTAEYQNRVAFFNSIPSAELGYSVECPIYFSEIQDEIKYGFTIDEIKQMYKPSW